MLPGDDFKGVLYGYARVSTVDQDLTLQIDALTAAGVPKSHIFKEEKSGRTMKRAQLQDLITRYLRPGDALVVWRLDRLGRTASGLLALVEELTKNDIKFISLQEGIDARTPAGKLMLTMLAAMAQFESDVNSERTKAGMAASRARGGKAGRDHYILSRPAKLLPFTKLWIEGRIPDGDIGARRFIKMMNEFDSKGPQYKSPGAYTNWKVQGFPGLREAWEKAAKGKGDLAELAREALTMPNCPPPVSEWEPSDE